MNCYHQRDSTYIECYLWHDSFAAELIVVKDRLTNKKHRLNFMKMKVQLQILGCFMAVGILSGCSRNPVTGKKEIILMSK